jgi:hypothetical protein
MNKAGGMAFFAPRYFYAAFDGRCHAPSLR